MTERVAERVHAPLGGRIELITGCMFSGKSTELQRRVRRYECAGRRVFAVHLASDSRYFVQGAAAAETSKPAHEYVTHDDRRMEAHVSVAALADVTLPPGTEVVAIDEAQFFPDLAAACDAWASAGLVVLVAALDSTYQRKPFGTVSELAAVAERIDKLSAVCVGCGHEAAFSHRKTASAELQVMGGAEMYEPLCRACWPGGT